MCHSLRWRGCVKPYYLEGGRGREEEGEGERKREGVDEVCT